MLQELDQVAVRVEQVVEMSRHLLSERNQLAKRLEEAEGYGINLQQQLSEEKAKVAALSESLQTETTSVNEENQRLKAQLDSLIAQVTALQDALAKSEEKASQLRSGAESVRHRVAHLLENLPVNMAS